MIRTILALCARDVGVEVMHARLRAQMDAFARQCPAWDQLLIDAEEQGMAPLLHKHLGAAEVAAPSPVRLRLHSLYLRSRQANAIRNRAMAEILTAFRDQSLDVLLVKGIALANLVYSDPALRPMRDIDLLVRPDDAARAEAILFSLGYNHEEREDIPPDYYHLPPLVKTVEGLSLNIEIHRALFPSHPDYPQWPFEQLLARALPLTIEGIPARTHSLEDMLRHVYLHGFRPPLTYEPFRLIHVADVVTLVEGHCMAIDWPNLVAAMPQLPAVFSAFHWLTPWTETVQGRLTLETQTPPAHPGEPYQGWPLRRLKTVPLRGYPNLAVATLWPSHWWVQVYYGHARGPSYWRARLFEHPRTLWRWLKTYWQRRTKQATTPCTSGH